ncbi:MAG: Cof-type HAD-IIB family hydrolase [Christensenellaceae bacterium]|jgi:Cof subfamily protein (haloacid dehalogenase superfamily)|nr:Cof-type HAD-IIB family hydrolase [Christensenellaceae bacterium]
MKYKMIVSDLDDTLLRDDLTCDPRLKDIIARYTASGGKFVIATGRMTSSAVPYARQLELTGEIITYQGARVSDIVTGQIFSEIAIPYQILAKVFRYLYDNDIYHQLYHNDRILVTEITKESLMYSNFITCDFLQLGIPLYKYVEENKLNVLKALVVDLPDKIDGHIARLNELFSSDLIINTSKKWIVELILKSAGKGVAVDQLAQKYGIDRSEVICIGDSANDVSMITYAGLGICVANASKAALDVAQYIAPSNNDGAVEHVIEKFGFI